MAEKHTVYLMPTMQFMDMRIIYPIYRKRRGNATLNDIPINLPIFYSIRNFSAKPCTHWACAQIDAFLTRVLTQPRLGQNGLSSVLDVMYSANIMDPKIGQNSHAEAPDRIEPARIDAPDGGRADLIAEVAAKTKGLEGALPAAAANPARLVRIMNSYYRNLIERLITRITLTCQSRVGA